MRVTLKFCFIIITAQLRMGALIESPPLHRRYQMHEQFKYLLILTYHVIRR